MVTSQQLTITLTGGGPWGFRLIGGEEFPLQIAKIRKRSKACSGGLQEGDTVVCINGVSMQGRSHPDAMYEVDNAGEKLNIAVQREGGSFQPLQLVEQRAQQPVAAPMPMSNGYGGAPGPKPVSTSQTFRDGKTTTNVVTGTYQQTSGGGSHHTKGFVKQVVQTQPGAVTRQQTTTRVTSFSNQASSNESPVRFQIKNLRNEFKENYTPMIFGQGTEHTYEDYMRPDDTVRMPRVFMVRDIKGTISGQSEQQPNYLPDAMNQPKVPRPLPPKAPKPVRMAPEQPQFKVPDQVPLPEYKPAPIPEPVIPQAPPPPLQPHEVPEPSDPVSYYPQDEPLFFPLPQAPFVNFDAHAYNEQIRSGNYNDAGDYEETPEEMEERFKGKWPIFAPKVEIHYDEEFLQNGMQNGFILERPDILPLDLSRKLSGAEMDSDPYTPGTPESSGVRKKKAHLDPYVAFKEDKKLYNDSAFYDAPDTDYPTIEDQITLCKKIARSLTSAANKKARGSKMFAKRKRRASKWIHDGESHIGSSSAGDVADLHDLDSELHLNEGGSNPLFSFRIPNIRNRILLTDGGTPKMSISQQEFEQLRLQQKKCEHKAVSPSTCHSLVADLHNQRNRGAKLFQKRQARSEKWVIDENNATKPMLSQQKINSFLESTSSVQNKAPTPWEAALGNPQGRVDNAFDQMDYSKPTPQQKYSPAPQLPQPAPQVAHDLSGTQNVSVVTGPNFNRTPKGWGCGPPPTAVQADEHHGYNTLRRQVSHKQEQPPPPPPKPLKATQENYNPKMRAWNPEMSGSYNHNTYNIARFRGPGGSAGPEQYGHRAADSYQNMVPSHMIIASDV
ncbi:uncharacterized protein LOC110463258 isoform X2 [Mizuhopecten yessoensis]|uniref:uncharacterized protein LOC110463258 isoform X2 n=1 Tax=Mizuhopecten yessoensis TaxID=6573 RepID=UPI000B45C959|nr:uncharacterized protein LOC110463258 isoform X2 [Mizuhopecten yessoensis]